VGGNVRDLSLEQIWSYGDAMRFARTETRETLLDGLWGYCKGCYYAEECRAGCNFTAHCTLGRRGNMPFCYHRATQMARKGVRERLVPVERPAGDPYDFGRFEVVEEPLAGATDPV
jgi:radical SAM protein with 4Fe4S-binding SPASM domain